MATENATGEKLPMCLIGMSKTSHCFKHIKIYPVNTNHIKRVEWKVKYLKNECANLTEHFEWKEAKLHYLLITVLHIHQFPI